MADTRLFPKLAAVSIVWLTVATGTTADRDRLVFHAEALDGAVVTSRRPDASFNPASVVKVGTSLWAIERLGADHRYTTGFGFTGARSGASDRIEGSLVVRGGGDPDFHVENAFLVARELNTIGIRTVTGGLLVTGSFWMGWENGAERRISDAQTRAVVMGERLRRALDPAMWDSQTEASWQGLCSRRNWDVTSPPRVIVRGPVLHRGSVDGTPLLVHRSNPLAVLLKRFNTYSNNDLVRVADGLGGVDALEQFLRSRLGARPHELEISTASGEGRNRMTARIVVRLMRQFMAVAEAEGLGVEQLLPVPGCDPGPTRRMFPRLVTGEFERTTACKTGTLTTTDGGVVVLAGTVDTRRHGSVVFCVAARRTGRELTRWRRLQQDWLVDLIGRFGGAAQFACRGEFPLSDAIAIVEAAADGNDAGGG